MINFNSRKPSKNTANREIQSIRKKIDSIDHKLIKLFTKRIRMVKKIGKIKKLAGIPINNEKREDEILRNIEKTVKEHELSDKIKNIYRTIFKVSKTIEKEVE